MLERFCEGGEEFAGLCSGMFEAAAQVGDEQGMVLALEALTSQLPYLLPCMVEQMEADAAELAPQLELIA